MTSGDLKLEIAVTGVDGAGIAADEGADRIELCSSLEIGGITPTQGLMDATVGEVRGRLEVHALIRCRPGNFRYSHSEIATMVQEARHLMPQGAAGIVFGVLTDRGTIDVRATRIIAEAARGLVPSAQLTFHRAIDHTRDLVEAVDTLVDLGFNRILSSGQAPTARLGLDTLQRLAKHTSGVLEVMAGGVLLAREIPQMHETGISAAHLSAKRTISTWESGAISHGSADGSDPTAYMLTDRTLVREARRACRVRPC